MQALFQISNRNAPRLAFANLGVEYCRGEIEFRRPLEGKVRAPECCARSWQGRT
jgi:hypothetical protein